MGAQRDIICALTLDPEGHETQALLARVLPGQSVKDVLRTREATQVRTELTASIANCACLNQLVKPSAVDSSVKEGENDAVYGIDLHVIDSSELGCSSSVPTLGEYPCVPSEQKPDTVSQDMHGVMSPQPISSTAGVMPDKSECLQEGRFHKVLFYTKKEVGAFEPNCCGCTCMNEGPCALPSDPAV